MATDRKAKIKQLRANGVIKKRELKKKRELQKDLNTLQAVLDHTAKLQAEKPELFAAVMDSVKTLAEEAGISVETMMKDGFEVVSDDGHKQTKTPQEILNDIANAHPVFKPAVRPAQRLKQIQQQMRDGAHQKEFSRRGAVLLDESLIKATRVGDVEFEVGAEAPSLERQREAATNIQKGLANLDLATCSDIALQEAMSMGYEPAVTEWLRRHPEAEASDGGRMA